MEFLFFHPFKLNQAPFEFAIPIDISPHCTRTRSLSRALLC
jgi:hypothetical protein